MRLQHEDPAGVREETKKLKNFLTPELKDIFTKSKHQELILKSKFHNDLSPNINATISSRGSPQECPSRK